LHRLGFNLNLIEIKPVTGPSNLFLRPKFLHNLKSILESFCSFGVGEAARGKFRY
jgi:hypothetical protein